MGRDNLTSNAITKFTTPEKFIEAKIHMLQEHFKIELTTDDIIRLKQYRTEGEINAAVRTIISEHWGG